MFRKLYLREEIVIGILLFVVMQSCQNKKEPLPPESSSLRAATSVFGHIGEDEVHKISLRNGQLTVDIIEYGGIIQRIAVPDRNGRETNVVLGFDNLEAYLGNHPYIGAIVGRYANRIADAKFTLDGNAYTLARNNGKNALHGGNYGFDKKLWKSNIIERDDAIGVELVTSSADMEEGYPGEMEIKVTYWLNIENELDIHYAATSSKATLCNLTNHAYFNLRGEGRGDVLDHYLIMHADFITPVNSDLIPTGEFMDVEGTPFDFRLPQLLGQYIDSDDQQISVAGGYDHNFIVRRGGAGQVIAAEIWSPSTGINMEVRTTMPGIQLYTGNFLDGSIIGMTGQAYQRRAGFCLETQFFPDSPNQASFPSTILRPGEVYQSASSYKFNIR